MKLIVSNSLVAGDIVVLRMKYKKSVQVVKYHARLSAAFLTNLYLLQILVKQTKFCFILD